MYVILRTIKRFCDVFARHSDLCYLSWDFNQLQPLGLIDGNVSKYLCSTVQSSTLQMTQGQSASVIVNSLKHYEMREMTRYD